MSKVIFIKPHLETDAIWDPIRTCPYLGIWYLACKLRLDGHQAIYLDETIREDALKKQKLFKRTLHPNGKYTQQPINITYQELQAAKMQDYNSLTPSKFVDKYSVFKQNSIVRYIAQTGNSIDKTLEYVNKEKPDFVGIPLIASANYIPATKLGKAIKQAFPSVKMLFGGQHISVDPIQFKKDNPWIDAVIVGDGISVITDIVEKRNNDEIIYGGFETMDKFPLLDPRVIFNNQQPGNNPLYAFPTEGRSAIDFMFSKGCFRNCEFCFAGSQPENHVTQTAYDKIEQQLEIFKKHGIEELIIQDDAFLYQPKTHLVKILEIMKKHEFFWQNNGGIEFEMLDNFVTDLLINYNKKGKGKATVLYIPFNPRTWNKDGSAAGSMSVRYKNNFNNLKRLRKEGGIYVFTSEIVGTPDNTADLMDSDINLHKKMISEGYLDAALSLSATMLPGTKWFKTNKHNIINQKDWPGYSLFTTHHRTENIKNPKTIEYYMIKRSKELDAYQQTYHWETAFPNSDPKNFRYDYL